MYNRARWVVNGNLHIVDKPAIICANGSESWWSNGVLHRDDGPAVIYHDGDKEWWLDDKQYTAEEYVLYQFTRG